MKSNRTNMRELLQAFWREVSSFIIAKSDIYFQSTSTMANDKYAKKARFYAFLPVEEEQRDWLERVYR